MRSGLEAEQELAIRSNWMLNRAALERVISAYNELSATYADGMLYASVSGDIGATVAPVGQAISTANGAVADIFTGKSFVLAYLPDSYLFEISAGQPVAVKAATTRFWMAGSSGFCPWLQNLPSDLQLPNRALERGRLVRIALPASNELPIDQRVRVTNCFLSDCRLGLMQAALQQTRAAAGASTKLRCRSVGNQSISSNGSHRQDVRAAHSNRRVPKWTTSILFAMLLMSALINLCSDRRRLDRCHRIRHFALFACGRSEADRAKFRPWGSLSRTGGKRTSWAGWSKATLRGSRCPACGFIWACTRTTPNPRRRDGAC